MPTVKLEDKSSFREVNSCIAWVLPFHTGQIIHVETIGKLGEYKIGLLDYKEGEKYLRLGEEQPLRIDIHDIKRILVPRS